MTMAASAEEPGRSRLGALRVCSRRAIPRDARGAQRQGTGLGLQLESLGAEDETPPVSELRLAPLCRGGSARRCHGHPGSCSPRTVTRARSSPAQPRLGPCSSAPTRTRRLFSSVGTKTGQMTDVTGSPPALGKELHAMGSSLRCRSRPLLCTLNLVRNHLRVFHSRRLLWGSKYLSSATFRSFCLPGTGALSVCGFSLCTSLWPNCSVTSDISLPPSLSASLL